MKPILIKTQFHFVFHIYRILILYFITKTSVCQPVQRFFIKNAHKET
jgi:hypothetical protein